MPLIRIESPEDPRVAPYVDLHNKKFGVRRGRFIAEGELVVQRLLRSRFSVESLLVAETQLERVKAPSSLPVYYAPLKMIEAIAGFRFHRGILGCGMRSSRGTWSTRLPPPDHPATVVVCSAVRDAENLGGILRNCAAFGVDLVLVGHRSADPFSRRALRVSMGAVLDLNVCVSDDLAGDIGILGRQHAFRCAATVLDPHAEPLPTARRSKHFALVLGNEFHGVDPGLEQVCHSRVTIPMSLATDSLNVAVASGIFLYHFSQLAETYESV